MVFSERREDPVQMLATPSMGWGLRLNKKGGGREKASQTAASISICFLAANAM